MGNKPEWLKVRPLSGQSAKEVFSILQEGGLNTVCEEAACPNIGECFAKRTATIMLLGRVCTRNCTFCAVSKGKAEPLDPHEPRRIAEAVKKLGLKYAVLTSVTRDDLTDGGAGQFAETIKQIRSFCDPTPVIEVLVPDFGGDAAALKKVVDAKPDVIGHNIETVPRLYSEVRPMASYARSLELLQRVKEIDKSITVKSGIMAGLGETHEEMRNAMTELAKAGCEVLTIGQYLAPSKQHHPVVEYIHPDIFKKYKEEGEKLGLKLVVSGPLVRSSYMAEQAFSELPRG
ncbi:MAG: lipoyl synthase [Bacillota bacterium]|nr:lipoyl synthase [Bacillota bacterium]